MESRIFKAGALHSCSSFTRVRSQEECLEHRPWPKCPLPSGHTSTPHDDGKSSEAARPSTLWSEQLSLCEPAGGAHPISRDGQGGDSFISTSIVTTSEPLSMRSEAAGDRNRDAAQWALNTGKQQGVGATAPLQMVHGCHHPSCL